MQIEFWGRTPPPVIEVDQLRGAVFEDLNLCHAVFEELDLRGATFRRSRLEAIFSKGADLRGATFESCNLINARLMGANLQDALFDRSVIVGAELSGTDLRGATMLNCDVNGRTMRGGTEEGPPILLVEGAIYDEHTTWPDGIDPQAFGAVFTPSTPEPAE